MLPIGVYSYTASAIAYAVLTSLLLASWRGRLQGSLLVSATLLSAIWGLVHAYEAYAQQVPYDVLFTVELAQAAAWLVFVVGLLGGVVTTVLPRLLVYAVYAASSGLVLYGVAALLLGEDIIPLGGGRVLTLGGLALALLGLVLIEQLYRNTPPEQRWSIKFLAVGVGGLFAYNLYMYADALLFNELDAALWDARGAVNALLMPLIALAVARNPNWSPRIFVSRHIVFYTTSLIGAGLYLLAMALGGYYINARGGDWAGAVQIIFLFGAGLVLAVIVSSGQTRARLKVFLSKHFYANKYDYRQEWLRLTHTLSDAQSPEALRLGVVCGLSDIVEATGGALWLKQDGRYVCAASLNLPQVSDCEVEGAPLVAFLQERDWIVDVAEHRRDDGSYEGLALPGWLAGMRQAWLVVPLRHQEQLLGFVVLGQPRAPRRIDWEDRDLLKTAGRQVASYLAFLSASEALSQARQFEAFNRLSAYVVHDLKNVTGQLDLVVANAGKHKHNPAFVEDAINTVDNAVTKMKRMLSQLRKGRFEAHAGELAALDTVLAEVVTRRAHVRPQPLLISGESGLQVVVDPERLGDILEHLIQNAQEATAPEGKVEVRLGRQQDMAVVEIEDSGAGMDAQFVRERLFKPFDTTKGNAGMGIGAYEAREFVRAAGGDVQVSSQPGVGSTFALTLPLAPTDSPVTS